jgi:MFS transporter, FSR family, fosmidomycin resistance protein
MAAIAHPRPEKKALAVACGAHVVHDGFTDALVVLLPLWQAEFGIGYAEIGLLRSLYTGSMAAFQVPAAWIARHVGAAPVLAAGTLVAGASFALMAMSGGYVALALALVVGGLGAGVQHPLASAIVAETHTGAKSRAALGTYNFAGDVGKMAVPALLAALVTISAWRPAAWVLAALGVAAAVILLSVMRSVQLHGAEPVPEAPRQSPDAAIPAQGYLSKGFVLLIATGLIDTSTRGGFLTFLPFLLIAKGASLPVVGVGLTLMFAGGAAGKLVCAYAGARYGMLRTVLVTESLTAIGIVALLPMPLEASLALLPFLGVALNGTSSVLYGSVPELVPPAARTRAFGLFYTVTVGASALAPLLYGLLSDGVGVSWAMGVAAAVILLTLPLATLLAGHLKMDHRP